MRCAPRWRDNTPIPLPYELRLGLCRFSARFPHIQIEEESYVADNRHITGPGSNCGRIWLRWRVFRTSISRVQTFTQSHPFAHSFVGACCHHRSLSDECVGWQPRPYPDYYRIKSHRWSSQYQTCPMVREWIDYEFGYNAD